MSNSGTQTALTNEQTDLLKKILEQVQISNVKLYGSSDADEEGETGRLPKVERSAKRAHARIDYLEKKIIWATGAAVGIGIFLSRIAEKMFQ